MVWRRHGRFPCLGIKMTKHDKNRDIVWAMAFGDRCFIKRCNNQLSVGVSGERYFGEEVRPGWSMWEDAAPLFWTIIGKTKTNRKNQVMALGGRHRLLSTKLPTKSMHLRKRGVWRGCMSRGERGGRAMPLFWGRRK